MKILTNQKTKDKMAVVSPHKSTLTLNVSELNTDQKAQ